MKKIRDRKDNIDNEEVVLYFEWLESVWLELTDVEQVILYEIYMIGNLKSNATTRLCQKFNYSDRQIHRIKDMALEKLIKYSIDSN